MQTLVGTGWEKQFAAAESGAVRSPHPLHGSLLLLHLILLLHGHLLL